MTAVVQPNDNTTVLKGNLTALRRPFKALILTSHPVFFVHPPIAPHHRQAPPPPPSPPHLFMCPRPHLQVRNLSLGLSSFLRIRNRSALSRTAVCSQCLTLRSFGPPLGIRRGNLVQAQVGVGLRVLEGIAWQVGTTLQQRHPPPLPLCISTPPATPHAQSCTRSASWVICRPPLPPPAARPSQSGMPPAPAPPPGSAAGWCAGTG